MSRAIITDKFPKFLVELEKLGVYIIKNQDDLRLPKYIAHHTDLQVCILSKLKKLAIVLKANPLKEVLENLGYTVYETTILPQKKYPMDCLCNAVSIGKYFFCNEKVIDKTVLNNAYSLGYDIVHVNQGYTACSICKVSDNAIITADEQIAKNAKKLNIDVLKIKPGGIKLNGYDYGFIGGCYGSDESNIYFTGKIKTLCEFEDVERFIIGHNKNIFELSQGDLIDIGGVLFI